MRSLFIAFLALLLITIVYGQEEVDDFVEDYFYTDEIDVIPTVPVPEGLSPGMIELSNTQLKPYKDLILNPSRSSHVLVLLSTSEETRASFVRAVKILQRRDGADIYFFAVPLEASDDTFEETFKDAHKISTLPEAGLHVLADFPPGTQYGMQLVRDHARIVDPLQLSDASWEEKLTSMVQELTAPPPPPPKESDGSQLYTFLVIGLCAHIAFSIIPRFYANREFLLPMITSKMTWLFLCTSVMFFSISGTFFTIIHGASLFYIGPNGVAFMHPSSQRQFALEGWTLGGMPLAASLVLIAVNKGMPYILGPDNRFHAATMLIMAFVMLCFFEHVLFTTKNRWYRLF
ncbi:hypothetical protein THRCLA_22262 [Thraustotheca clavata]|uniref:Uncharacterized protein n=1 Tax=Thraustotheca clavata TaxID=74557 RepID=A0A1V9Z7R5_9STRA|nr:hypothetical protein THRCLA_22262 [Thraustotheca clavata]